MRNWSNPFPVSLHSFEWENWLARCVWGSFMLYFSVVHFRLAVPLTTECREVTIQTHTKLCAFSQGWEIDWASVRIRITWNKLFIVLKTFVRSHIQFFPHKNVFLLTVVTWNVNRRSTFLVRPNFATFWRLLWNHSQKRRYHMQLLFSQYWRNGTVKEANNPASVTNQPN